MLIARVIGDLTATRKHPAHESQKLLLVQPVELDGADRGDAVVAVDSVGAGVGSLVLLTQEGFSAFSSIGQMLTPVDAAVIGIVDTIDLDAA